MSANIKLYKKFRKLIDCETDIDGKLTDYIDLVTIKNFAKNINIQQMVALQAFLEIEKHYIYFDNQNRGSISLTAEIDNVGLFDDHSKEENQAYNYLAGTKDSNDYHDMVDHIGLELYIDHSELNTPSLSLNIQVKCWDETHYDYIENSEIKIKNTVQELIQDINKKVEDYSDIATSKENLQEIRNLLNYHVGEINR